MNGERSSAEMRDAVAVARGVDAAGDGTSLSRGKVRARKRKYTRTAEAWAVRAAKRRAKLAAKYGSSFDSRVGQNGCERAPVAPTTADGQCTNVAHEASIDVAHASTAAAVSAVACAGDVAWERGVQSDFVERVVLASRGVQNYIDVDSTIAVMVRDEILRAQWLGQYDLAAAYAGGAICSIAWEHSIE